MNVYLRVDSSLSIGSGHIFRCLSLAKALKKAGSLCFFISKNHHGNILEKLTKEDFPVKIIPVNETSDVYVRDEKDWLHGSQSDDAEQFIAFVTELCVQPDIVIVDHYSLDGEWERIIKTRFPDTFLVVIDDLCNRQHYCDLLIDQTYQRSAEEYAHLNMNNGKVLAGTKFALLNPLFSQLKNNSILRKENITSPKKILITMGGVDAQNIAGKTLELLEQIDLPEIKKITIVLGAACPHSQNIITLANKSKFCVDVLVNVSNMAEIMLEHDIAIGALGGTTWERCVMGLPAVNVVIADNQKTIATNLAEAGAIVLNACSYNLFELSTALTELIENYHKQRLLAMDICDGQGLIRDIQEIITLPAKDGMNVTLRQATSNDIDFVYKLQCEPKTRQFARDPNIPEYENHVKWMHSKLNARDSYFYIIEHGHPCGVVRLDPIEHDDASYEISIFLSSASHGKGIASVAIKRALMLHSDTVILATVLPENYASHQLFERLGFCKASSGEYISEIK